jgi:AcrR family transcriptional regulator
VDAILEASTRVFLLRGYAGATTNEVAEVAGVSIGSLYQYFPDKTALLTALHEQHLSLMRARLTDVLHGSTPSPPTITSTLTAVARHCLELHHDNLELQCLLHQHYPQLAPSPFASKAKAQLNQAVMDWLRRNFSDVGEARVALVSGTLLRLTENLVHATVLSPCSGLPVSTMETNIATALHVYLEAQGLTEKRA